MVNWSVQPDASMKGSSSSSGVLAAAAADSSLKMWLVMMVGSVTYTAVFKVDRERGKRLVEHQPDS